MAISQLINRGATPKTFKATGGDVAITISAGTNLANSAGRMSAQLDLGAFPRTTLYEWKAKFRSNVAATLAAACTLYLVQGDGTYVDGNLGTADAAVAGSDKLNNLKQIGQILVDISNTTDYMQASGVFTCSSRYMSLLVRNSTGQAINDFEFVMTEIISQTVAS